MINADTSRKGQQDFERGEGWRRCAIGLGYLHDVGNVVECRMDGKKPSLANETLTCAQMAAKFSSGQE